MGSLIFIDTSAFVAILAGEDDADHYLAAIKSAKERCTGAHVRLECGINLARLIKAELNRAEALFDRFLEMMSIAVVPITDDVSKSAVQAFSRFGKGRGHPAQLNFGDCLSYGCAAEHGAAILFKGRDFIHTDLELA